MMIKAAAPNIQALLDGMIESLEDVAAKLTLLDQASPGGASTDLAMTAAQSVAAKAAELARDALLLNARLRAAARPNRTRRTSNGRPKRSPKA